MVRIIFLISFSILGDFILGGNTFASEFPVAVNAITNCNGTQVQRVAPGKFEVRYVASNLPGCIGASSMEFSGTSPGYQSGMTSPETVTISETINCSGLKITALSTGKYASTRVAPNLPGCINTSPESNLETPKINLSQGPLLDLASTDIVKYRAELLRKQGVRFTEVIRSVRIRQAANMQARTNAYLMDNSAVVISSPDSGWVKSQVAQVVVTDIQENTIVANKEGGAKGYIASKYLRNPNTSDLVRIEQADHAYWSDIARVKVAHKVNVRSHPSYTSKIVTTLKNNTPLYIVSTVDNWSLVRSDDGSVQGYIRSDFLTVERVQRVDNPHMEKTPITPVVSPIESSVSESSWIGF